MSPLLWDILVVSTMATNLFDSAQLRTCFHAVEFLLESHLEGMCEIVPCDLENLLLRRGIHVDGPNLDFFGEEKSFGKVCEWWEGVSLRVPTDI